MMTYRELVNNGKKFSEDADILIRELNDWDLGKYLLMMDNPVPEEEARHFLDLCQRLENHEPLQHLTKKAPFYGREFIVSDKVLIPRFDTEILVDEVIRFLAENPASSVLDLCTGSGIIALTIALETGTPFITASDISKDALNVAEENRRKFRIDNIRFVLSNMFEQLTGTFDVIVSNPPYIRREEISALSPEVRDHDPFIALDGGEDGLQFYRIIAKKAKKYLNPGGRVFLEIGYDQAEDVKELFENSGYRNISVIKDLAQKDRVVTCLTDSKI